MKVSPLPVSGLRETNKIENKAVPKLVGGVEEEVKWKMNGGTRKTPK